MDEPNDEAEYPSGPWRGYYNYEANGVRHRQELTLNFKSGNVSGDGLDGVGPFWIRGRYDRERREVWWTKSYVAAHTVHYRGFREKQGIWGTWEISAFARGGFLIWPVGQGGGIEETLDASVPVEPELVVVGKPAPDAT